MSVPRAARRLENGLRGRQTGQNGDAQTLATQGQRGTQTDQEVPDHGLAPGSQAARGARRLRHRDPDSSEHRWAPALQVRHGGSQPDVRGDRSQPAAACQKRGSVSLLCAQKLARLQTIVAERAVWTESLAQVKRL